MPGAMIGADGHFFRNLLHNIINHQEEHVPTEVREHEGRGHTFRTGVLLYLACIAVCALFFSLGFLVGYNEHGSHMGPTTEVVAAPSVTPPTINPPPDSGQIAPPDVAASSPSANIEPQTEVISSKGEGPIAATHEEKPAKPLSSKKQHKAEAQPAPNPPSPRAVAPGEVGEGIMLQVAALRTKQDAEAMVGVLKKHGFQVFMVIPDNPHAADSLYRVQVGPFRTRPEADKVRDKLVQEGFKPFVKH
jgi:DedD protein